ncbi:hypothetical protein [Bacterioplanoides sp.]|uniref:hypothetical protein n=1 Tax=Bacterioplanoides sp. TaxID=2066072 RepID=UPI003B5CAAB1
MSKSSLCALVDFPLLLVKINQAFFFLFFFQFVKAGQNIFLSVAGHFYNRLFVADSDHAHSTLRFMTSFFAHNSTGLLGVLPLDPR